jgi:hypothetical protein
MQYVPLSTHECYSALTDSYTQCLNCWGGVTPSSLINPPPEHGGPPTPQGGVNPRSVRRYCACSSVQLLLYLDLDALTVIAMTALEIPESQIESQMFYKTGKI